MNGPNEQCLLDLAGVDWDRPAWREQFYPADLPADWRLSYYANEFASVLVPARHWLSARLSDVRQWQVDVPEAFRFYVQVTEPMTHPPHWDEITQAFVALGPKLGGLILDMPSTRADAIAAALAQQSRAVLMLTTHGRSASLHRCWQPGCEGDHGSIGWAAFSDRPDPKHLREVIEAFTAACGGAQCTLFIEADFHTVDDARTIMRLLGLGACRS